jgi:NTE family protein
MPLRFRPFLLAACLLPCLSLAAEMPRVALVLGGGGARGLAHVGVLKVLEEARIPVDCVVGTSMGALVGGLYASGKSATEVDKAVAAINWDDVLNDRPQRQQRSFHDKQDDWLNMMDLGLGLSDSGQMLFPKGALGTQKVDLLIRRLVNGATLNRFDELPLPYRAVAADLENGDMVVLSRGDLAAAMRASMAVPGVFPPVERDTRVLVDGGIARNLPVDVARGVCGEVVIAVDVGSPLLTRKQASDVLSISDQTVRVLTQRNVDEQIRQLAARDILIRPDLGSMSSSSFNEGPMAQAAGEKAARELLPMLQSLSVSEADYAAWRAKLAARRFDPGPVLAVEVEPTRFVNPSILRDLLDVKLGKPLDLDALEHKLGNVYARDDFEQIDYRLLPGVGGHAISLSAREKSWGPGYLDLGLGMRTDFEDDSAFQLSAQYRRSWLNRLGGEWKTRLLIGEARGLYTSLYQPLSLDGELYLRLGANVNSRGVPIYLFGERVAEYRQTRRALRFDVGSTWGRWGQISVGAERAVSRFARSTGATELPDERLNEGGLYLNLAYDQLDSARYPRQGSYAALELYRSLPGLGGLVDYRTATLDLKQAASFGRWSGLLGLKYVHTSNEAPFEFTPTAGGLFNLSGYHQGEVRAERIASAQLRISQDVAKLTPLFGNAGFWGVSLEAARIWSPVLQGLDEGPLLYSGALFLGSDTRLGPAYLGLGYGDTRHLRVYLSINGGF